jgi:hypothetical protein
LISPQASLGAALVLSEVYANSLMVLVNDRISARLETANVATLQLDVVLTDIASGQPVTEEVAGGEPSGVQAAV